MHPKNFVSCISLLFASKYLICLVFFSVTHGLFRGMLFNNYIWSIFNISLYLLNIFILMTILHICIFLSSPKYIFSLLFREIEEGKKERRERNSKERERETSIHCLTYMPRPRSNLQLRYISWQGIKPATFRYSTMLQLTELCWPGPYLHFHNCVFLYVLEQIYIDCFKTVVKFCI